MDREKFSDTLSVKHFFFNGGQIALKFSRWTETHLSIIYLWKGNILHRAFIGVYCQIQTANLLWYLLQESENILLMCYAFNVKLISTKH